MNLKHNRDEVLKKGMSMFCNTGYSNLGVDAICKFTGMTKGAFYHSFKSKEDFLVEAIRLYSENNVARIKKELASKENIKAIDIIEAFYTKMITIQPQNNFTGCFINNMMSEMGFSNETIGQLTAEEYDRFIDNIEPCVSLAQKDGDLKTDLDSKQITELLHATFYGILTRLKSSKNVNQGLETMKLLINNIKTKKG